MAVVQRSGESTAADCSAPSRGKAGRLGFGGDGCGWEEDAGVAGRQIKEEAGDHGAYAVLACGSPGK